MSSQFSERDADVDVEVDNASVILQSIDDEDDEDISTSSQHASIQVPPTSFAPPYRSTYLAELLTQNKNIHKQLKHVNCNYLSTGGVAPTLVQLKQHAQSLAVLIKHLTISTHPMVIDNPDAELTSRDGETWDWLNDLSKPYTGPKNDELVHHHNLPLTALLNVLEQIPSSSSQEGFTIRDQCPLHNAGHLLETMPNASSLPYATHQSLIAHANKVLELIDQQYSAKGGLLSILPPESDKKDREKAESTLLGQFILYTQRLVVRLHELERQYANSLDMLAGESVVPTQTLSALGPDGRQGRELTYPQDRFVLVNAGQDVLSHLDREFHRKELSDDEMRREFLQHGVTGERLFTKKNGHEYERGITAIDITTRYYRLVNDPLKTIFVIPAWESHPGVSATIEMEKRPTVVSVVQPIWPERVSLWEQKNRDRLSQLTTFERENEAMKRTIKHKEDEVTFLRLEVEKTNQTNRNLTRKLAKFDTATEESIAAEIQALEDREMALQMSSTTVQQAIAEAKRMRGSINADRDAMNADIARRRADIEAREKASKENILRRMRKIAEMEREMDVAGKQFWEKNQAELARQVGVVNRMKEAVMDQAGFKGPPNRVGTQDPARRLVGSPTASEIEARAFYVGVDNGSPETSRATSSSVVDDSELEKELFEAFKNDE